MAGHRAQWSVCRREGAKEEGSRGCLFRLENPCECCHFSFQVEEFFRARRCEGRSQLLYHHSGEPADWIIVGMLHSKGDEKTNGGLVISFESLQDSVVTPPSRDVCKTKVMIVILVVV